MIRSLPDSLASLADVYVNDAFAVSHRAHASVSAVTAYFADRKAAGILLQKEMDYFHRSMAEPVRPLVAIVGGAKVSSKLGALENMLAKVDRLLIGGAMANTFLKSQGFDGWCLQGGGRSSGCRPADTREGQGERGEGLSAGGRDRGGPFCRGCGVQAGDRAGYPRPAGWLWISARPP